MALHQPKTQNKRIWFPSLVSWPGDRTVAEMQTFALE